MEGVCDLDGYTRKFDVINGESNTREILTVVYDSLRQKGYNPVNQIVGYILSEDPTYVTNYNNARALICRLDRDELLSELVSYYLNN
ncbi:MAG: IreB family regulatory phosphoprotein [Oscillospiraceae bacterium]|nr:IreB family regulatory phosphoprotein [Oscillospiraceae bacterium]